MDEPDRRTTPPILQIPGLLLVIFLVIYFLAGFHYTIRDAAPAWVAYGTWEMFTITGRSTTVVKAEVQRGGGWEPFDLEALFPYRWETGPRYARFYDEGRQRKVLRAACGRSPEPIRAIRLYGERWDLFPHGRERVRKRRVEMIEHRCGRAT
jgi:hypothetical protein